MDITKKNNFFSLFSHGGIRRRSMSLSLRPTDYAAQDARHSWTKGVLGKKTLRYFSLASHRDCVVSQFKRTSNIELRKEPEILLSFSSIQNWKLKWKDMRVRMRVRCSYIS